MHSILVIKRDGSDVDEGVVILEKGREEGVGDDNDDDDEEVEADDDDEEGEADDDDDEGEGDEVEEEEVEEIHDDDSNVESEEEKRFQRSVNLLELLDEAPERLYNSYETYALSLLGALSFLQEKGDFTPQQIEIFEPNRRSFWQLVESISMEKIRSISLRRDISFSNLTKIVKETFTEEICMKSNNLDKVFRHILNTLINMPGINHIGREPERRIFFQTIAAIAKHKIVSIGPIPSNDSLRHVLQAFPGKRLDWLPLHFAVSLPDVNPSDVESILVAYQGDINRSVTFEDRSLTPCHLAAIMLDPNLEIIRLLGKYWPSNTNNCLWPEAFREEFCKLNALGLAVQISNSPAMIKELMRIEPPQWTDESAANFVPIKMVFANSLPESPQILQAMLSAAPAGVNLANVFSLHDVMEFKESPQWIEMLSMVLSHCPELVNMEKDGILPIHLAAQHRSLRVLKMIYELNPANLSHSQSREGSVAHHAALEGRIENLRFIHSLMPELMLTFDGFRHTPFQVAVATFAENAFIEEVYSLAPLTAHLLDYEENNILHLHILPSRPTIKFMEMKPSTWGLPTSDSMKTLRFLLRILPNGVKEVNGFSQTPYDQMWDEEDQFRGEDDCYYIYPRRIMLMADRTYKPEVLRELNYAERKGALLAFCGKADPPNVFHRAGEDIRRIIVSFI